MAEGDDMPQRIPTGVWLTTKFERLLKMTETIVQDSERHYTEPEYGFWSLKKEIALMYWIWPFLTIASEYFDSFFYVDLFAGPGLMKANDHYFVGSPVVAVGSTLPDKQFSEYVCFEIDPLRSENLKERMEVASKRFGTPPAKVFNVDCNRQLLAILEDVCPKGNICFLAFVDPENIKDLKWKTVYELLTYCKGDMILTFPTVGIVRNLNIAKHNRKMGRLFFDFFGENGWRDVASNADSIVEYYKARVSRTNELKRSVDSLSVRDESNHRLYDIIFATGSTGMRNAMKDMKKRLNRIRTQDFRAIHEVIAEKSQSQLTNFSHSFE